jgi:hypothetical protein
MAHSTSAVQNFGPETNWKTQIRPSRSSEAFHGIHITEIHTSSRLFEYLKNILSVTLSDPGQ